MPTSHLQHTLAQLSANHLLRVRYLIEHDQDGAITSNGKACVNFCGNDYLQLAHHPYVKKALIIGAEKYGLGSGASAMVSGYCKPHYQLEQAFAEFLNRDSAMLFNSGYHANLGVLATLANRNSTIIADKFCHASLIDGAVLSRAQLQRYPHNDMQQAATLLNKHAKKADLLISESIFSIQGDMTDVKTLSALASQHQCTLVVDDAHGIGVLGASGAGITDELQLSQDAVPCLITPLGKAMASMGAIVSGSKAMIETLVQLARTYRYSTALPPAICNASLCALQLLQKETWRRDTLKQLIRFFIKEAKARQLQLFSQDMTPIKSITIGCNLKTLSLQKKLMQRGLFVSCIRPPTVPINSACIRISLNCAHTEGQIRYLLDSLKEEIEATGYE